LTNTGESTKTTSHWWTLCR